MSMKPKPITNQTDLRKFKVRKIFAEWTVYLCKDEQDTPDSLLKKALEEIEKKRIFPDPPGQGYTIEEV